jgi:hypothetical protein
MENNCALVTVIREKNENPKDPGFTPYPEQP